MKNKVSKIFFLIALITGTCRLAVAQHSGTRIRPGKNSAHIIRIYGDTLLVAAGSTYRYTVDTREGEGLVSTAPEVNQLIAEVASEDGFVQQYCISDSAGTVKYSGKVATGDYLTVTAANGTSTRKYLIITKPAALAGRLGLSRNGITVDTKNKLILYFKAGQRSPDVTIAIYLPPGIKADLDKATIDVIGRGAVRLKDLAAQSIGRTGTDYSYNRVGGVTISESGGGKKITLSHIDLRADNGCDIEITLNDLEINHAGEYKISAAYTTARPERLSSSGLETAQVALKAVTTIAGFQRVVNRSLQYTESAGTYSRVAFKWPAVAGTSAQLQQSTDRGKTWQSSAYAVDLKACHVSVSGLRPDLLYCFRLMVKNGRNKGASDVVWFYSGKMDIKNMGAVADGVEDNTDKINAAIAYLNGIGGGTLFFSRGTYSVRSIRLKSNVYLYISKGATLQAIKGGDAPETTWFCDRGYRSGLSPTDAGPYANPENYMTKQDVGHQYFHNAMFWGERLDNIKIIGNGRITGNGNLVTSDKVMNNQPDNRSDKMFSLKLCTNVEIGGLWRKEDLWYSPDKDEPVYLGKAMTTDNMLNIDRGGHFVVLATGTDNINVHDCYTGKYAVSDSRDIFDFMECRHVSATNIYSKTTSDDIIKIGSDCSLGFTRPAFGFKVRNIIGDTNCNLMQIGSETADDIRDVYADNIYVLGANKAGFSISANDGAEVKNIQLNSGYTGPVNVRSKMYRCSTPFFISISNRGRVIGADARMYSFNEDGKIHHELLVKNVNIGRIEDVRLCGVDISEVYGGSSYRSSRWKPYDGSQRKATPIVSGYKLPDATDVAGGLDFKLPDGRAAAYVKNITFNDINLLVKGGNSLADTADMPPEMGVGQYNVSDLKVQPSYGLWARHVIGLTVKNCSFNYEKRDSRYPLFLDDVKGAAISSVKVTLPRDNHILIGLKNAANITVRKVIYFNDKWGVPAKAKEYRYTR